MLCIPGISALCSRSVALFRRSVPVQDSVPARSQDRPKRENSAGFQTSSCK
uniref:Uncharacterized protein n=1 Tax=Anopheles albimanus TaxID=7167 RepID=A0A182FX15_ANOAL